MAGASDNNNSSEVWTIERTMEWTISYFESKGLENPRLDAQMLLAEALDLSRIMLYAFFERPLVSEERERLRQLVARRAKGEPVAYILGSRGFRTIELDVDQRVLIPRPETEQLVDFAISFLEREVAESPQKIIDVGTGSGAIALSLLFEREDIEVAATDISEQALEVAQHNAEKLELSDRVTFAQGDLFEGLGRGWEQVDLVLSNPPYVAESERGELSAEVLNFEPAGALFAGEDGLDIIRRLAAQGLSRLRAGGQLICEIGYQQGPAAAAIFEEAGFDEVEVLKDFDGKDRFIRAQKT